jgi:hypothetical protein
LRDTQRKLFYSNYDKILEVCGYCEMFAKKYGILVAVAAILVKLTKNDFAEVKKKFLAIFGGLLGILTRLHRGMNYCSDNFLKKSYLSSIETRSIKENTHTISSTRRPSRQDYRGRNLKSSVRMFSYKDNEGW